MGAMCSDAGQNKYQLKCGMKTIMMRITYQSIFRDASNNPEITIGFSRTHRQCVRTSELKQYAF